MCKKIRIELDRQPDKLTPQTRKNVQSVLSSDILVLISKLKFDFKNFI